MAPLTHYELYAFEESKWTLQKRFISSERNEAIEEAKSMEGFMGLPTKVIREYHNPQSGLSDTHIVYISPRAKDMKEQAQLARKGSTLSQGHRPNVKIPEGLEDYSNYQYTDDELADKRYAKSMGDLLSRVLLVITASMILAAMGTSLLSAALRLFNFGNQVGLEIMKHAMFGSFLIFFAFSTVLIGRKLIPFAGILAKQPTPKTRRERKYTPAPAEEEDSTSAKNKAKDQDVEIDPVALMDEHKELTQPPSPVDAETQREIERQAKLKAEADEQARKAREESEKAEADATADTADGTSDAPPSEGEEAARTAAMTFLGGTVAALTTLSIQLDVFTRFGVNLYLAGACEALAGHLGLPQSGKDALLREMMDVMGTRSALASMFIDKMEEYLLEPRYMLMFQAGRDAMGVQLSNAGDPFRPLPQVMEDWSTPQAKKPTSNTIAIVFTDMVGSTDINSQVGDLIARDITRVHNRIVRSALSRFDGREVKHTGDGIMATFQVISQAVEAAVEIQRAMETHNAHHPDLSIALRVGINAGEPVKEENDYYGIAVTLAARICAEASGGSILCSGVVRDLSQGAAFRFQERGATKLKGISDPQRLFEIIWESNTDTADREKPDDPAGKTVDRALNESENKPD